MPLISKVGRRSVKTRLLFTLLFVVLSLGAASIIYPLLIMLAGSTASIADYNAHAPYPKFWFDDLCLFQKYAESKYNGAVDQLEASWRYRFEDWEKIPKPDPVDPQLLDDFLEWRPLSPWWNLGHVRPSNLLASNARMFRDQLYKKYNGDINAFRDDLKLPYKHWNHIFLPYPNPTRTSDPDDPFTLACKEYAKTRPADERVLVNLDGAYYCFLRGKYPKIEDYNKAHNTKFQRYDEIFLTPDAPPESQPLQRTNWNDFVRQNPQLKLAYIHLDPDNPVLAPNYHNFLKTTYKNDIAAYNVKFETAWKSFDEIPFTITAPTSRYVQVDWASFIRNEKFCPLDAIHLYGPRQAFEEFVAKKHNLPRDKVGPLNMPIAQADWHDMNAHKSDLRWEFTTRNYKAALGFIALHGNGIINTIIFCGLAVLTNLLVNPLAAYALSRFRLPSTYTILLFCMATMAFPGEVTMIPRFLLLKSFPLWSLLTGTAAFALILTVLTRFLPRSHELFRIFIALALGVTVGAWLIPSYIITENVSLLNTFAALILPGMANGFSIFLLKGFFDSLPQELYEAADLDGASEWTKFWMITMGLSKPILAVIGLGAFTGAYAQFMMALIIIPDRKMWTIMVWLYQFQQIAHQSVQYAALVIAAIPTLLVFIFCQNLIIRGIVVPVEK
ncbi:MAG: carbohydrate ABC transporter permease [Phycisphaerales bacterium]|nr:carbohydrate ABC transporter permease [Phycisphaerales bacterium]